MAVEDLPREISVDITEPYPMEIGGREVQDENYLWRVELYLISKYQPEFVDATIFKIRAAALERAKIVKEDHLIHSSLSSLQDAIESDLMHHVTWMPQRSHRATGRAISPGIGGGYQRELDRL
jgi:hypothetical protein